MTSGEQIQRVHHEVQPLTSLKNRKASLDLAKKRLKKPAQVWNSILWTDETRSTCTRMKGRTSMQKAWYDSWPNAHHILWYKQCDGMGQWHWVTSVYWWCDRSSRMFSKVYMDVLSARIQANAASLIGHRFTVQKDNDPKHAVKANQEFIRVKKCKILQWPRQSPDFNLIKHSFHLLKINLTAERPSIHQV